ALGSWQQLQKFDLTHHLFPLTAMWLNNDPDGIRAAYIVQALSNTDERVASDKPITPMFLFAVLLWGPISGRARQLMDEEQMSGVQALVAAGAELMAIQCQRIAVPKRFSLPMREVIQMQPRFENRKGKRAQSLLAHRRFRAAYDLYELRTLLGEVPQEALDWWTEAQANSAVQPAQEPARQPRKRRRKRRTKTKD
ncbi:MAG: polynucleotide adenylyltransferase PcnB, partial [Gammaproteobacteria bacterium]|nr:polynucleotide adenylyltransferase PcnB [Gammaproteobacteria bacterium]